MTAHSEVGGVLDQGPVERDQEGAVDELARLQRDERVPGEEAGAHGGPLGHPGGVVEVDLVHRPDLGTLTVEGLAADQAARIDVGLHGASTGHDCIRWSRLLHQLYERPHPGRRPLETARADPAGRLEHGC